MQDKGISETTFPRLLNDGTPTPAGIVAIFMAGVLVLAMINVVNRVDTTTDIVDLQLKGTAAQQRDGHHRVVPRFGSDSR